MTTSALTLTRARAADIASQLLTGAVTDGGATVPTVPGVRVPTVGYLVGGAGPGLVLPFPHQQAAGEHVLATEWTERSLVRASLPQHYLGSWIGPDGRLYLDVVTWHAERATAVAIGRARGEQAVWSLTDSAEILCGPDLLVSGA